MLITMSNKEIQRLAVLQDVRDHRITQVRAAEILNLSTRQITRLEGINSIAEANTWLPGFIEQFSQKFAKCARNPKNLYRPLTESNLELYDIFTWQEPRKVTKSLTISYDKCIYLLEPTELNQTLIGQHIAFLEYPDGTVAIMHEGRKINYRIFNKLLGLQQNEVVENKRLGSVLAHIQKQHEELDK